MNRIGFLTFFLSVVTLFPQLAPAQGRFSRACRICVWPIVWFWFNRATPYSSPPVSLPQQESMSPLQSTRLVQPPLTSLFWLK